MEPALIHAASRIVGFLAPYALDKTVELGTKIGKSAVDKIGKWLDDLRARWADDPEAEEALNRFEADPQNQAASMTQILADRMRLDESLARSAEELAKQVGPTVVVTMVGGEIERQFGPEFGKVLRGTVQVDQSLQKGEQMKGPTFGDIG